MFPSSFRKCSLQSFHSGFGVEVLLSIWDKLRKRQTDEEAETGKMVSMCAHSPQLLRVSLRLPFATFLLQRGVGALREAPRSRWQRNARQ